MHQAQASRVSHCRETAEQLFPHEMGHVPKTAAFALQTFNVGAVMRIDYAHGADEGGCLLVHY